MRATMIFLLILSLALAACNLPVAPDTASDETPMAAYTMAAETIIAQLTQNAPPATATVPAVEQPSPAGPTSEPPTALPPSVEPPTAAPPTPLPEPSATLAPTVAPKVLYQDDFSQQGRWYEYESDNWGFRYLEDAYLIYVNILNAPVWSMREVDYADVILDVDALRYSGPKTGYYGLVCRHVDEDNYYALVIGSDGAYGIAKMEDGEFEWLEEGVDNAGLIRRDDAVNRVRAVCVGGSLSLFANGSKLLEVQDDDLVSGSVGLIAGTRMKEGLQALFDNFAIIEP